MARCWPEQEAVHTWMDKWGITELPAGSVRALKDAVTQPRIDAVRELDRQLQVAREERDELARKLDEEREIRKHDLELFRATRANGREANKRAGALKRTISRLESEVKSLVEIFEPGSWEQSESESEPGESDVQVRD